MYTNVVFDSYEGKLNNFHFISDLFYTLMAFFMQCIEFFGVL